jgi:hypothetical protein
MPPASKKIVLSGRLMNFAGGSWHEPLKRDLIDLDHNAGKRLAFRMTSLDMLSADPASVELTTPRTMIFPA